MLLGDCVCLVGNSGSLRPCSGPPGGLPPRHNTQLEMHSESRAREEPRSRSHSGAVRGWGETRDMGPHIACTRRRTWNPNAAAGLSDATEKLKNVEASRMFFLDGTVSAVTYALLLGITRLAVLCDLTKGSTEFSGWELWWCVCTCGNT